jgi:hypothetical protein
MVSGRNDAQEAGKHTPSWVGDPDLQRSAVLEELTMGRTKTLQLQEAYTLGLRCEEGECVFCRAQCDR